MRFNLSAYGVFLFGVFDYGGQVLPRALRGTMQDLTLVFR